MIICPVWLKMKLFLTLSTIYLCCTVTPKGCTLCEYKINKQDCQSTDKVIKVTCQLTSPINGSTTQHYNSKSIKIDVKKRGE